MEELLPTVKDEPAAVAPPAPIITEYVTPGFTVSGVSAEAPPPELSPETDERYPPAPPPPIEDGL